MDRFARGIWAFAVFVVLALVGCIGPPLDPGQEVAASEAALEQPAGDACTRAAFEQYLECRELECTPDALVVHGYDRLCDRDCQQEAAMVYADCDAVTYADVVAAPPTKATLRVWHEPDYRITERGGPTDEGCIRCGLPLR